MQLLAARLDLPALTHESDRPDLGHGPDGNNNGACNDPVRPAKVRIYRSKGENVRELRAGMREKAKSDEGIQFARTLRIAEGHAHHARNCATVYRKST
ncbi:hypothetical protein [Burkholderia sp. Ac-20353]|uniref:hypothetical protein n=1 Tax=Burkholderia sp. Ac-20353 TaxID=2703894 RepID=UPI00197BE946|nr:hypothetical protein [Burkholderia sp. Ac-20353]MBN3789002.1 hypothetical protein [Burkholderia sp. Ac-20353]